MNIDRLRYFSVIVETRNLRKASELIGITPGSLSKAMAVLESEMKLKLLRPEGRGIEITDKGLEIYRKSIALLDEYKRFHLTIREPKNLNEHLQLKIGTFEVFSTHLLTSFLASEMPDYQATILELAPGDIEKKVQEGIVDYGITYLPVSHPKLEFTEVGSFNMSIWGLRDKWSQIPFKDWPFAVPTTAVRMHTTAHDSLDLWPNSQKMRTIKYGFELLETGLQTTRLGLSVIHCPDFIAMIHNKYVASKYQLERLPYPTGMKKIKPVKAYLVYKKGTAKEKSLEGKLAKMFRSLHQDIP